MLVQDINVSIHPIPTSVPAKSEEETLNTRRFWGRKTTNSSKRQNDNISTFGPVIECVLVPFTFLPLADFPARLLISLSGVCFLKPSAKAALFSVLSSRLGQESPPHGFLTAKRYPSQPLNPSFSERRQDSTIEQKQGRGWKLII